MQAIGGCRRLTGRRRSIWVIRSKYLTQAVKATMEVGQRRRDTSNEIEEFVRRAPRKGKDSGSNPDAQTNFDSELAETRTNSTMKIRGGRMYSLAQGMIDRSTKLTLRGRQQPTPLDKLSCLFHGNLQWSRRTEGDVIE